MPLTRFLSGVTALVVELALGALCLIAFRHRLGLWPHPRPTAAASPPGKTPGAL